MVAWEARCVVDVGVVELVLLDEGLGEDFGSVGAGVRGREKLERMWWSYFIFFWACSRFRIIISSRSERERRSSYAVLRI